MTEKHGIRIMINGKVYIIEGNSSDEIKLKSYSLDNKSIFGYGITK